MTTIKITSNQLPKQFEDFKGAQFIGIKTVTSPKFIKKSRISGESFMDVVGTSSENIVKVSTVSAGMGYDYETSVKNKLIKEGKSIENYVRGNCSHESYNGLSMIRVNKISGQLYFYYTCNSNNKSKSRYINKITYEEISESVLEQFLPVESKFNHGLNEGNEVIVRTVKLENILSISACGNSYEIEPSKNS